MAKKPTKPAVKLSATDRQELLAAIETAELIANQLELRNPVRADLEYHRLSDTIRREGHPIRSLLRQTGEIVRQKMTVTQGDDGKEVETLTDTDGRIPTFGTTDLHRAIYGLLNTLGTWYARKSAPQNVAQRERIHQPCADAVRSYCKEVRQFLGSHDGPLTDQQQQVFDLIAGEGPIQGTYICGKTGVTQSGLTKYIIPILKEKRGVKVAPGSGYYLPTK